MAEEFQAAVCGGSWWSSPTATFNLGSSFMGSYGGCWPDSASQTMGYQALSVNGRTGESYSETLTEILSNCGDSTGNFGMDPQQNSNFMTNSGDSTGNFGGDSTGTSYGYPSSMLQSLFDGTSPPPPPAAAPPQQPIYNINQANINDYDRVSSMVFYCNTSGLDVNDNQTGLFSPEQSSYLSSTYEEKPECGGNIKSRNEDIRDDMGSSAKKSGSESLFKRHRLETPSPLPTFKVRKEKLGDRVTALQQLVSPFGKTDTASVLYEAIEYIKLLHDQVNILSNPYMKNQATMHVHQIEEQNKEGGKQQADLRSRGLCLMPVSSTFPVATETAPEYWTSIFRSTFN